MNVPRAGFTNPHAWSLEIITETGIMFGESAELELVHGLLVWPRVHRRNRYCAGGGVSEEAEGETTGDGD